jgi:predicted DCC family thiol-disulfide oxidoreductase YuxK
LPIDISAPGFDPQSYGISLEAFMAELHAIDQSGTVYRGVAAFRAIWQAFPEKTAYRVLARLVGLPLVEPLAGRAYRLFARLRPHLPGRKPGCDGGSCRLDR